MNLQKGWIIISSLLITSITYAQNGIAVTDQQPVVVNGLEMGYRIKSEETKQVSDKGDFSRFSLSFYIRNNSGDEKIIFYRPGWNGSLIASDQLVQFNCLNATGARLTSKSVTLNAKPCMLMAQTNEKDCVSGKMVDVKKMVQVGYSIKPGEVVEASAIMIVPLNQKPVMQAALLASQLQQTAGNPNTVNDPPMQGADFIRLKNVLTNTYVNTENDRLSSGPIKPDWWSAQWQLIPATVNGNNYYTIKNRWKESFLTADQGRLVLLPDNSATGSLWILLPSNDPNVVRIKNGRTGAYIIVSDGQLSLSVGQTIDPNSYWVMQH